MKIIFSQDLVRFGMRQIGLLVITLGNIYKLKGRREIKIFSLATMARLPHWIQTGSWMLNCFFDGSNEFTRLSTLQRLLRPRPLQTAGNLWVVLTEDCAFLNRRITTCLSGELYSAPFYYYLHSLLPFNCLSSFFIPSA